MRDYYSILEVNPTATGETIAKSYRSLMKKNHPDINKAWDAREKAILINQAYEILSDPVKREEFDQKFFEQYVKEGPGKKQREEVHRGFHSWFLILLFVFADTWYLLRSIDPVPIAPAIVILFLLYTAVRDRKRKIIARMAWVVGVYLVWIGLQGAVTMIVWKFSARAPLAQFLIAISQCLPVWLIMRRSAHM